MGQCLTSKDGRDTAQLASKLKVEPCVWFGGGRCNHFNSKLKVEPRRRPMQQLQQFAGAPGGSDQGAALGSIGR